MADGVKYVAEGLAPSLDPGATVEGGDVKAFATPNFIGVWAADGVNGTPAALRLQGVFRFPKQAALAINFGDLCYWDDTAKEIDTTNTNVNAGVCLKTAAAGDAEVEVFITPAFAVHS